MSTQNPPSIFEKAKAQIATMNGESEQSGTVLSGNVPGGEDLESVLKIHEEASMLAKELASNPSVSPENVFDKVSKEENERRARELLEISKAVYEQEILETAAQSPILPGIPEAQPQPEPVSAPTPRRESISDTSRFNTEIKMTLPVTKEDVDKFVNCMISGERYSEVVSMHGGAISFEFVEKTHQEEVFLMQEITRIVSEKLMTSGEYSILHNDILLLASLRAINGRRDPIISGVKLPGPGQKAVPLESQVASSMVSQITENMGSMAIICLTAFTEKINRIKRILAGQEELPVGKQPSGSADTDG